MEIKNTEETEKQHYIRHGWQKKGKKYPVEIRRTFLEEGLNSTHVYAIPVH